MQALRAAPTQLAGRVAVPQRRAVVAAARPTAAADFRGLSDAELVAQVKSLKAEYTKLQYLKRTRGKVQNPESLQEQADDSAAPKGHEFKAVRRQVAQALTLLRERQIADGVGRKAARALKREASVAAGMGGR